ncbi:Glucosamine 6-phosphate N-acetyltransferase [Tolypocladium capitatum]|uniref:Glucosamine 6-phosphate N-acetyltransferase n=1 Tax=Tolypocladium capitatum TaxID=45235 RepID=A0A2K3QN97_9HYPO|nr:Glucosamine 6-phosphate N-acetyltransferase [Tolypocladium capitatum]
MAAPKPLFPASLISTEVASSLPDGYTVRPLNKGDHAKGFLECLQDLTWVGKFSVDDFNERYDEMDTDGKGPYYIVVIEHEGRIVGAGTAFVEKKFIHNRALVGHLEEICISKDYQGKGLGLKMLNALDSIAQNLGCRMNSLNCDDEMQPFYVKCGYSPSGREMHHLFVDEEEEE